jgi:hypothetical protein
VLTVLTQLELNSNSADYDILRYLTNGDMELMALAWPALEVFTLGLGTWHLLNDSTPCLSLCALDILCAHCPEIRSVRLTMNTDPVPATPARLTRPKSGPLKSLDFSLSTIKDPYAIAKWLGDACVADCITFTEYYPNPRHEPLSEVGHSFQSPRSQFITFGLCVRWKA